MKNGLIHLYSGDGKGKTTAAVGLVVRAYASGEKIIFAQFMKDGKSGEINVLKTFDDLEYMCAKDIPDGFYSRMDEEDQKKFAESQNELFQQLMKRVTDVSQCEKGAIVVMDEITYAYNWDLIDKKELLVFLQNKPDNLEVILTGRNPSPEIVDLVDYYTEMSSKKHPLSAGIQARKGIEY